MALGMRYDREPGLQLKVRDSAKGFFNIGLEVAMGKRVVLWSKSWRVTSLAVAELLLAALTFKACTTRASAISRLAANRSRFSRMRGKTLR